MRTNGAGALREAVQFIMILPAMNNWIMDNKEGPLLRHINRPRQPRGPEKDKKNTPKKLKAFSKSRAGGRFYGQAEL
jgi:hypothetical protein